MKQKLIKDILLHIFIAAFFAMSGLVSNAEGSCGSAANSNYACNATQTSGTLCINNVTCYLNAGYPPTPCPTNIAISGNLAHWYCGTDQNCYAKKLDSCATPTPTPPICTPDCSCATDTPIGSTCSNKCGGSCNGQKLVESTGGDGPACEVNNYLCCTSNNPTYRKEDLLCNYPSLQGGDPGLLKETCDGSEKEAHVCIVQENGKVIRWIPIEARVSGWPNADPALANVAPYGSKSNFRVFFPPGTTRFDVFVNHQSEKLRYLFNTRYNKIPVNQIKYQEGGMLSFGDINADKFFEGVEFDGYKSGTGYSPIFEGNLTSPLTISQAGWAYYSGLGLNSTTNKTSDNWLSVVGQIIHVDVATYNDWYRHSGSNSDGSINWKKDVESVLTYSAANSNCASATCIGNSCWNGTSYVAGTKTTDCATGSASASPASLIAPGSSFVKWNSVNASRMEAVCLAGPIVSPNGRGDWYTSDVECKNSGLVSGCTDKGFEFKFIAGQNGTEICNFYPINKTDNLPGTPFSVSIQVTNSPICGNSILEGTEECDYTPSSGLSSYVPCPTGKTCKDCKCVTPTKTSGYVCQPDDPNCAKLTCKDVKCFDGCNYRQGSKDCKGRE